MKRGREPEEDDSLESLPDEQDAAVIPVPKIVNLDTDELNVESPSSIIQCSLPGHVHGMSFKSYGDYEKHYSNAHTNRCLDCWKNFPSAYILDLHIREYHDALTEIRRDKGEKVYACFVETCGDKFEHHGKRETHLVKAHMFPPNYFFAVTKFGIDRRQSMLVDYSKKPGSQRKGPRYHNQKPKDAQQSTTAPANSGDAYASRDVQMGEYGDPCTVKDVQMSENDTPREERREEKPETNAVDTGMQNLAAAMSSLKFVPRVVRLGPKRKA